MGQSLITIFKVKSDQQGIVFFNDTAYRHFKKNLYKEKQKFGYYARDSFEETKSWLRKCYQRNLLSENQRKEICQDMAKIGPKLNRLINTLKFPSNL